jgi:hypothetical protein
LECNSQKADRPAEEFLRRLYRERRLSTAELTGPSAPCMSWPAASCALIY